MTTDPSMLLGRPKVANRLPTVLRAAEAVTLVEAPIAVEDDPTRAGAPALRDRAILELLYGSGVRVGEVTTLTPEALDLDRGRVRVLGKGSKERRVPLSEDAVDALRAWLADGRPASGAGLRRTRFS